MKQIIIMLFVVVATTVNANAQTDPKDSRVNIRKGPGVFYPVVETCRGGALVVFKKQTLIGWKFLSKPMVAGNIKDISKMTA